MSSFKSPSSGLPIFALMTLFLTACVPNDQLVVTQETITEVKDDVAEGISTRVDATVNAITETVNTVASDLTGGDEEAETTLSEDESTAAPQDGDEIVVAAIAPEEEEVLPPPSLDPKSFLGQSITDLTLSLGGEDYRRLDQDVLVLQYRMPSCIIDFVMSPERQVTSYHGRHRVSGENYDDVACRLELAARRDSQ